MKGQTLIEALLVLAALALVFSGIAVTIASSLNNAGYGRNQSRATQYAQDGVDVVRAYRNNNYIAFKNLSGNYCLPEGQTIINVNDTCSSPNADNFIRSVVIEQSPGCAPSVYRATVSVSWTDGKCTSGAYCHASKLVSCISTVNPIQFYSPNATTPIPTGGSTPVPTPTPTIGGPVSVTVSMSVSPNPAFTSQNLVFTATVTGNCTPAGAVYFYKNSETSYFSAGALNNGTASAGYPASAIGPGNHTVIGRFFSGGTCPAANSPAAEFVIQ